MTEAEASTDTTKIIKGELVVEKRYKLTEIARTEEPGGSFVVTFRRGRQGKLYVAREMPDGTTAAINEAPGRQVANWMHKNLVATSAS